MNSLLTRAFSLLLVPCLVVEPALANSVFASEMSIRFSVASAQTTLYQTQALMPGEVMMHRSFAFKAQMIAIGFILTFLLHGQAVSPPAAQTAQTVQSEKERERDAEQRLAPVLAPFVGKNESEDEESFSVPSEETELDLRSVVGQDGARAVLEVLCRAFVASPTQGMEALLREATQSDNIPMLAPLLDILESGKETNPRLVEILVSGLGEQLLWTHDSGSSERIRRLMVGMVQGDENLGVRRSAIQTLGMLGEKGLADLRSIQSRMTDPDLQGAILLQLTSSDPARALEQAGRLLLDLSKPTPLRLQAAEALDVLAIEPSEDHDVKDLSLIPQALHILVKALEQERDREVMDRLLDSLTSDRQDDEAVVECLHRFLIMRSVDEIEALLSRMVDPYRHQSSNNAAALSRALGEIRDLKILLKAVAILPPTDSHILPTLVDAYRRSENTEEAAAIIHAVPSTDGAFETLKDFLGMERRPALRKLLISRLSGTDHSELLSLLPPIVTDPQEVMDVRQAAVEALEKPLHVRADTQDTKWDQAFSILQGLLSQISEEPLQITVLHTLTLSDESRALPMLGDILRQSPKAALRKAAAENLGRILQDAQPYFPEIEPRSPLLDQALDALLNVWEAEQDAAVCHAIVVAVGYAEDDRGLDFLGEVIIKDNEDAMAAFESLKQQAARDDSSGASARRVLGTVLSRTGDSYLRQKIKQVLDAFDQKNKSETRRQGFITDMGTWAAIGPLLWILGGAFAFAMAKLPHRKTRPLPPATPAEQRLDTSQRPEGPPMIVGMDFGIASLAGQIVQLSKTFMRRMREKADPVPMRTKMLFNISTGEHTWILNFSTFLRRRIVWLSGGNARSMLLSGGAIFCNYIVIWDTLQKKAVLVHAMSGGRRCAKVVLRDALDYLGIDPANRSYLRKHLRSAIARPNVLLVLYTGWLSWSIARSFAAELDSLGIRRLPTDWHRAWFRQPVGFKIDEGKFVAMDGSRTLDLNNQPPAAPAEAPQPHRFASHVFRSIRSFFVPAQETRDGVEAWTFSHRGGMIAFLVVIGAAVGGISTYLSHLYIGEGDISIRRAMAHFAFYLPSSVILNYAATIVGQLWRLKFVKVKKMLLYALSEVLEDLPSFFCVIFFPSIFGEGAKSAVPDLIVGVLSLYFIFIPLALKLKALTPTEFDLARQNFWKTTAWGHLAWWSLYKFGVYRQVRRWQIVMAVGEALWDFILTCVLAWWFTMKSGSGNGDSSPGTKLRGTGVPGVPRPSMLRKFVLKAA